MAYNPQVKRRLMTNYFTTAANATEQQFTFVNNVDDYKTRHIRSIFVGLATAGITMRFYVEGQLVTSVDLTRFAAGDEILSFDVDVPAKLQPTISFQDLAGAAHTNIPVVLGYEVDANSGGI